MWRLYSALGQGIAIESTVGQLEASLGKRANLQIDSVRYSDFDKDPIEKGHRHYGLFMKRKSYEHEKELRATILLLREGEGILGQCDLATLVTEVHVSPYTERYVKDAVEKLCKGEAHVLRKPVLQSNGFARRCIAHARRFLSVRGTCRTDISCGTLLRDAADRR